MSEKYEDTRSLRRLNIEAWRRIEDLRVGGQRFNLPPGNEAQPETCESIISATDEILELEFVSELTEDVRAAAFLVENPTFLNGDRYPAHIVENKVMAEIWLSGDQENWSRAIRYRIFQNDSMGPCVIFEKDGGYRPWFVWERLLGSQLFSLHEEVAQALLQDLRTSVRREVYHRQKVAERRSALLSPAKR